MTVIVAAVLIGVGLQSRRVTESAEWCIVANAAVTLGTGFLALLLSVMVGCIEVAHRKDRCKRLLLMTSIGNGNGG
jgi:hypothetical protein